MQTKTESIGIGSRIGKLTVVSNTGKRKNGYIIWHCACGCGGSIDLDTRTLQRGTVLDCGCESRVKPGQKDLTGVRFGKLVCVEPTAKRQYGCAVWRCVCDCGNTVLVSTHQLTAGYVKSCGCLSHPPLKDFVGKWFGSLTVIAYAGKRAGMHRWRCRCDCGNETVVGQTLLQTGKTISCGCRQRDTLRENLKLVDGTSVTLLEKGRNRLIRSNTSGYTGVYQNKRTGKWVAQITFKRKTYYLGAYAKKEDAVKARQQGEEMHDDFLEAYYRGNASAELKEKDKVNTLARGKYKKKRERKQKLLQTGVTELGLPAKTVHVLEQAGIHTVMELTGKSAKELQAIPGIGPKTAEVILEKLR